MVQDGNWELLGNIYYRKVQIYAMQWQEKLKSCKFVTAAPYGGPIALVRKNSQMSSLVINIFTSSGNEIGMIQWNSGRLLKLGWSNREELLCLQDDGNVLVYNITGTFIGNFSMGKDASDVKIIDGQMFTTSSGSTGVVVLTSTYRFYLVSNIYDVRVKRLDDLPDTEIAPSSWIVINGGLTPQILVAKEADIYTLDITSFSGKQRVMKSDQLMFHTEMAVSFDSKFLAIFTSTGVLWIGSSDLKDCYCEYDTENLSRPNQLVWCGKSAVVAKWDDYMLLIGPTKDCIRFDFDFPFHLVAEKDGVRIIGEKTLEFLQKVPRELEDIFKIGSVTPGAVLFEASKMFKEEKKDSYEYIKMVKDSLPEAYMSCLKAAGYEFNHDNQKALLRAASFAKCFLENQRSKEFMDKCQKLRILNSLRSAEVGIPLTIIQLNQLTVEVLISRLLMRKLYWLAFEISKYLKMPDATGVNEVLSKWACDKIQNLRMDDSDLARKIKEKFEENRGVSYAEIINKAIQCKRTNLALELISCESRAMEQIPALLKLNRDPEALRAAISSGDTNLMSLVLEHWKDKPNQPLSEFLRNISFFPTAYSLYLKQCKEVNKEMSLDIHTQSDNHLEQALCRIALSYDENQKNDQRLSQLVSTQQAFIEAKKEIFAKLTEEQVKLMKYQIQFEAELDRPFLDKSLSETLNDLLLHNNHKQFEHVKKEFKISDRRLWWLKIQAYAEAGNWSELEKFSKSKKSPIGYEPFIDMCIKYNNLNEASNYLSRILPEHLVKYNIKLGQLETAAELAMQSKNEDDVDLVISKCSPSHRTIIEKLNAFKSSQQIRR